MRLFFQVGFVLTSAVYLYASEVLRTLKDNRAALIDGDYSYLWVFSKSAVYPVSWLVLAYVCGAMSEFAGSPWDDA